MDAAERYFGLEQYLKPEDIALLNENRCVCVFVLCVFVYACFHVRLRSIPQRLTLTVSLCT